MAINKTPTYRSDIRELKQITEKNYAFVASYYYQRQSNMMKALAKKYNLNSDKDSINEYMEILNEILKNASEKMQAEFDKRVGAISNFITTTDITLSNGKKMEQKVFKELDEQEMMELAQTFGININKLKSFIPYQASTKKYGKGTQTKDSILGFIEEEFINTSIGYFIDLVNNQANKAINHVLQEFANGVGVGTARVEGKTASRSS